MWCLLMGHSWQGFYVEVKLHSLDDMKILSGVFIISGGGVAVTDLTMVSKLTPTFTNPFLPPNYDFLYLFVQPLPHTLSLPLLMPLPQPSFFP